MGSAAAGALAPASQDTCLERYLPLALLTTGVVAVLPVALVSLVIDSENPELMMAAGLLAMGLSLAFASAGAALWKRWPGSCDVVFSELMLWGWLRRFTTERRLARERARYESAREHGQATGMDSIERLSRLLQTRDAATQGHSQRVARHAWRIARAMHLPTSECERVRAAAIVHDVGKLYTPREVLNNPTFLNDEEYRVVKRHPVDGADMIAEAGDAQIATLVRHHHERIDGSGYPDGLAGEDIPLGARIIAVADTFDAISSNRPYRSARTHKKALDVLAEEAGTRLDGAVVAAFVGSYTARRSLAGLAFGAAICERLLVWLQASSPSLGLSTAGVAPIVPALGAIGAIALTHVPHGASGASALAHGHQTRSHALVLADRSPAPEAATRTAAATFKASAPGPARPRRDRLRPAPWPLAGAPALTSTPVGPAQGSSGAGLQQAPTSGETVSSSQARSGVSTPSSGTAEAATPSSGTASTAGAGSQPSAAAAGVVERLSAATATTPASVTSTASNAPSSTPSVSVPSTQVAVTTPAGNATASTPALEVPAVRVP